MCMTELRQASGRGQPGRIEGTFPSGRLPKLGLLIVRAAQAPEFLRAKVAITGVVTVLTVFGCGTRGIDDATSPVGQNGECAEVAR